MNKNTNFLYLMIAILTVAIGYFYIDKTNPEFFQNFINKFSNSGDSGWEDEVIPEDNPIPKDLPESKPKPEPEDDLKITPPSDEELLPPEEQDNSRRPRRRS